ncbi:SRPBCC family protein [Streptomyces sp. NPDC096012]|uniref:SRPBCC family protein n=1 Tax=Streptomyces sp. NPDC096012 TaxID=3155684 RepID=UPI00336AC4EE
MELQHEFTVPVPVDDAWHALLDIERVAPCLPGAAVEEYDGTTVTGSVKVKVGPVTVTYRGTAVFQEQDESAHRMVLVASGRETRGQGTARATVTGTLTGRDGGTAVSVRTDLTVTGRPAQFGRGVLAEVGDRLVGRFAECLAQRLAERPPAEAEPQRPDGTAPAPPRLVPAAAQSPGATEPEPLPRSQAGPAFPEPEPLDLLRTAGMPLAKRAAGLTAVIALLAWAGTRLRHRDRRGRTASRR